ncbi:uncharacterized protein LOC142591025 isoform X1 [Dermacentor variabilis]|uniref:uncharacterized protein LOC142591025 isoform X1 n=1 Tax=Dermacentor variabilis TaxID=34621 RepID=UPI003F5B77A5
MKLITAILLARLTWCSDIPGSYQSGQSKMEKMETVIKMLKQKVPLVLHWVESRAVSIEPYSCIQLLYTSQESDDILYCVVSNGWTESATRKVRTGRTNADVSIKFLHTPLNLILNVEDISNKAAVKYIKGAYVILYADAACVILRSQNDVADEPVCTAWVPANTVEHLHLQCRDAFFSLCRSCQPRVYSWERITAVSHDA